MNKSEFLKAIDEVIEADPGTLQGPEELANVSEWNSLAVLGFIAMVDERFSVTVSAKRLAACKTVNDLVGLLGDRVND